MDRIRFAIAGSGWRAKFFIRIADELPNLFEITGIFWTRGEEKARQISEQTGIKTFTDLDALLKTKPEYVITALTREPMFRFNLELIKRRVNVLSETPGAPDTEKLIELWERSREYNSKLCIAEQYFLNPTISSILEIIKLGLIGEVTNVNLSFCHGYHAMCLIRKMLGVRFENAKISGRRYEFGVLETSSRNGDVIGGEVLPKQREFAFIEFDGGKLAVYDFDNVQYHSWIRGRKIQVQGTKGEISDDCVRYMTQSGMPAVEKITRVDVGHSGDVQGFFHKATMLGGRTLFKNHFGYARLSDEDIAIAQMLLKMGEYVRGGEPHYPLADALQDSYLSFEMERAIVTGQEIQTKKQPWAVD